LEFQYREAKEKTVKTVLTLSGGMDSTVLLYHLKAMGHHVRCLSVDYGQRHRKELVAAAVIARGADCEHRVADLSGLGFLFAGSSQTSPEIAVPEGHYAEPSMKTTVVPNRNMVLLSLATAWAVATKSDYVAYAAHAGDHAIYPDCRKEFADTMSKAIELCDWHPVFLARPFIDKTKADIVKEGIQLGVPFDKTWSCYKGGEYHCGACGTCVERKEAFQLAGAKDPVCYLTDHVKEA
jgi:7-cyano-7-deazaguanine synthase